MSLGRLAGDGLAGDGEAVGGGVLAVAAFEEGGGLLEYPRAQAREDQGVDDPGGDQRDRQPGQRIERAGLARPQVTPDGNGHHGHPDHRDDHPQPGVLADAAAAQPDPLHDQRGVGAQVHDHQAEDPVGGQEAGGRARVGEGGGDHADRDARRHERDRGGGRRPEPGADGGQRLAPQPAAGAGEDHPGGLGVGGHVGTGHAGQEDPGDEGGDERDEGLGGGVERVRVGRQDAGAAHPERRDQRVRADDVDDAADDDRADDRDRHVAPGVLGLLGQRGSGLEAAEGQDRQAEREQDVGGMAARPAERGGRQPVVAAPDQDGDAHHHQQDDLERVQRDRHPDAEPQPDHHRRDHERAVGDGDDLGQAPDMRIAEYVLDDITADEYVNAAEGDDVAEDRDHADRDRRFGTYGASDVGDERSGARVNTGKLRQAARRGNHAHH